jgi:hypothetical protein
MNGGTVVVAWDVATSNPATYVIEAGTSVGLANLVNLNLASAATSMAAQAVPPGVYYVRLRAANACGGGPASNELIVTAP